MVTEHEDSFAEFAAARARPLFRAAYLLAGDWHLAEDLVQEALARMFTVWRCRAKIDNLEAYSQKVLVRTYLSMRRRRSFFERPTVEIAEPVARWEDIDLRLTLEAALAQLSPTDRAVLVLRYVCDRSVEQVAADLHRSPAAIRSTSKRALNRLRCALGVDRLAELAATYG